MHGIGENGLAHSFHSLFKLTVMADNPNKKKADGKRISQQPHEQAYQKRKGAKEGSDSNSDSKQKTSAKRGSGKSERRG